ncbi:hypothetical protein SD80_008045 [Scytonema tolypothrichoides VB-61278]|nr:hypothetical protein SD80_008045 [Scytonema tolypothrichoides VB-61278]
MPKLKLANLPIFRTSKFNLRSESGEIEQMSTIALIVGAGSGLSASLSRLFVMESVDKIRKIPKPTLKNPP